MITINNGNVFLAGIDKSTFSVSFSLDNQQNLNFNIYKQQQDYFTIKKKNFELYLNES